MLVVCMVAVGDGGAGMNVAAAASGVHRSACWPPPSQLVLPTHAPDAEPTAGQWPMCPVCMNPIKLITASRPDAVASYYDWLAHRSRGHMDRKWVVTLGYNTRKLEEKRFVPGWTATRARSGLLLRVRRRVVMSQPHR